MQKEAVKEATLGEPRHTAKELQELTGEDRLATIAQLYWYHEALSGTPRQVLMQMLDMPRSTVNVLLRKVNKTYPLPR
jgi:hypothetical protein